MQLTTKEQISYPVDSVVCGRHSVELFKVLEENAESAFVFAVSLQTGKTQLLSKHYAIGIPVADPLAFASAQCTRVQWDLLHTPYRVVKYWLWTDSKYKFPWYFKRIYRACPYCGSNIKCHDMMPVGITLYCPCSHTFAVFHEEAN